MPIKFSNAHYYRIARRYIFGGPLLRETNLSVVHIALAVGYTNPSHFAQIFRRETGLTPSDYRGQR